MNDTNNAYNAVLIELRRVLAENQITQSQVGEKLGIRQSAVSSLINGKSKLTLEQFLELSSLIGERPHKLLSTAEAATSQTLPMPAEVEQVLYRSEVHLVAYCAATQPISIQDLTTEEYTATKVRQAFDELTEVGILTKKREKYIQTNPNLTYKASSHNRPNACHQKVVINAWKMWERLREKQGPQHKFFNLYRLDRFTMGQIKEIDTILYKIHEKILIFQRENMAAGYTNNEAMPLWNIHLMIMQPLGK